LKLSQLHTKLKITEINGHNMFGRRTERQTATLHYEISTMWEVKPRTTPLETSRMSMGPKQVTRSKPCKLYHHHHRHHHHHHYRRRRRHHQHRHHHNNNNHHHCRRRRRHHHLSRRLYPRQITRQFNALRTGDADLRF